MFFGNTSLLWTIGGVFAALTVGTLVRMISLRGAAPGLAHSRMSSLKTWWGLAILLSMAVLLDKLGVVLLLGLAAVLSLREYITLVGWKEVGQPTVWIVFGFIPLYYSLAFLGYGEVVREVAPVAFLLVLGGARAWLGRIEGYIRTTAAMFWGWMLFVYCLSHAYFLISTPAFSQPSVGAVGWFLYLVILTETSDIVQALIGRRFGKTKITPRISPNKSLEGLVGGTIATMLLSVLLAPWLTTLMPKVTWSGVGWGLFSGMLISIVGFLGGINMSGMKRDAGVKDGSALLPGQGGMIDRIDSLTFTAPAFYYFIRAVTHVVGAGG